MHFLQNIESWLVFIKVFIILFLFGIIYSQSVSFCNYTTTLYWIQGWKLQFNLNIFFISVHSVVILYNWRRDYCCCTCNRLQSRGKKKIKLFNHVSIRRVPCLNLLTHSVRKKHCIATIGCQRFKSTIEQRFRSKSLL